MQVHFWEVTESQGRISETKMVRASSLMSFSDVHLFLLLVLAAQTIANVVKSSLGPMGLDKMLVDNIGVSLDIEYRKYIPLF